MSIAVTPAMIETFRAAWLEADESCGPGFRIVAGLEAVLATLPEPRTVSTPGELDALWRDNTVLRTSDGTTWGPCHGFRYIGWWQPLDRSPGDSWTSSALLEDFGPVVILNATEAQS